MHNRLPIPKFFVSQWLHVKKFQEELQKMVDQGLEIRPDSVLPIMASIVKEVSGADTVDGVSVNTLAKAVRLLKESIGSSDMDDEWFIRKFGQIYEQVLNLRQNDDYVVNPGQMDKFLDLVSFFMQKANKYDEDFVEVEKTEPKQEFGGVTATFVVFDLTGNDEVQNFCKVLKCCSAVSVDSTTDNMVCISCTVPNVFVPKPQ